MFSAWSSGRDCNSWCRIFARSCASGSVSLVGVCGSDARADLRIWYTGGVVTKYVLPDLSLRGLDCCASSVDMSGRWGRSGTCSVGSMSSYVLSVEKFVGSHCFWSNLSLSNVNHCFSIWGGRYLFSVCRQSWTAERWWFSRENLIVAKSEMLSLVIYSLGTDLSAPVNKCNNRKWVGLVCLT